MEKLDKKEILNIVDGCYYGQAMPYEVNQLIKEFIEQQDSEVERLKTAIKYALGYEANEEEDEEMILNGMKSYLQGVLDKVW